MSNSPMFKKLTFFMMLGAVTLTNAASAQWTQATGITGIVTSLISNDTFTWAGSDTGGVYRSSNGQSWTAVNNGIGTKTIKAIARNNGRLIAAMYSLGGAFALSDNNGDSWFD